MNELQMAEMLTELGSEVAVASERAAEAMRNMAAVAADLSALSHRIHSVVKQILIEDAVVVATVTKPTVEAAETPTRMAEPEVVPAPEPEPVHSLAPDAMDGAPLSRPWCYEEVLNRFAIAGDNHNTLAEEFGVRVGIISKCLDTARRSNDPRVAQGDLKRVEALDADAGPGMPSAAAMATIEPTPDEVGNLLATVVYTDGVVMRADTSDHVRMKGPGLRIVALLKDQRFYPVDEVKAASRHSSDAVFRSALIDVQRALAQIGLHIVENAHEGFQLRKIDQNQARAAA